MKKNIVFALCALIALSLSAPILAQSSASASMVKVRITPTKGSWDYRAGERIRMAVSVEKNELPLHDIEFEYEAGPELVAPTTKGRASTKDGVVTLDLGRMDKPGFFNLDVRVKVDGLDYRQWKTVSIDREHLQPTVTMPDDFQSYWQSQLDADVAMPLRPQMVLLPERCTDKSDVYEISYVYTPQGGRFYGILCVPKAEGKFPAILRVPGAGVRPYQGSTWQSDKGFITLDVGIHGISVTLAPVVYERLFAGILNRYYTMNLESRDDYYYNRVIRGCKRAVDFIFTLDKFNGRIGVQGSSQGGALTVMMAALDHRVCCAAAALPAMSDMTGYLHGRAGGWPHLLKNPENCIYNSKEIVETLRYYDVVNFARLLKIPVYYMLSYNDKTCPPTSTFSVYNATTAPKQMQLTNETGHWYYPEQAGMMDAHIEKYLLQ
jgi:cephalosporin-C deacetylase-like acetyl esterase